jgi:hypothetical protein
MGEGAERAGAPGAAAVRRRRRRHGVHHRQLPHDRLRRQQLPRARRAARLLRRQRVGRAARGRRAADAAGGRPELHRHGAAAAVPVPAPARLQGLHGRRGRPHRRSLPAARRPHGRAEDRRRPRQRQERGAAALARPVRRLRAHHRPAHQPERPGALVPERPRLRPDRAARGAAAALHLGPLAAARPARHHGPDGARRHAERRLTGIG